MNGLDEMALAEAIGVTSNTVARRQRGEMAISEPVADSPKNRRRTTLAEWEDARGPMAAIERHLRAKLGAKTIGAVLTTSAAVFKLAQRRYGTNMRADSSPRARFA